MGDYKLLEGRLEAKGLSIPIVASRYNEFITGRLIEGAVDCLVRHGARAADIRVVRVPGALEIPLAAKRLARPGRADAVICLGTILRGETPHFEYVAAEVAKGVAAVSLESGIPISFGVITADTLEQAIDRAGTKAGNKGFEAAMSAMEMANLMAVLK